MKLSNDRQGAPSRRWSAWMSIGLLVALVSIPILAAADPVSDPAGGGHPSEPATRVSVSLGDIPAEIDRSRTALREAAMVAKVSQDVERVREDRAAFARELDRQSGDIRARLASRPTVEVLEELARDSLVTQKQVRSWSELLAARAGALDDALAKIRAMSTRWQEIERDAKREDAPRATLVRVADLRREIERVEQGLESERDRTLTLQSHVADLTEQISSITTAISDARAERVGRLFVRDRPPLWSRSVREVELRSLSTSFVTALASGLDASVGYVRSHATGIALQLAAIGVLIWLLLHAREHMTRWQRDDPELGAIARVLSRPISAALVLAAIPLPSLHPLAPSLLGAMVSSLLLIPALRILSPLFGPGLRPALTLLAGFYLLDQLRHAAVGIPLLPRAIFVLEMGAGTLFMLQLLRPKRLAALPPAAGRESRFRWTGRGLRMLRLAFAIGFLAAVVGYVQLGVLIGSGALKSAYLAALLFAASRTAHGLIAFALRAPGLGNLRLVRRHLSLLEGRANRATRALAFFVWLAATLEFFSLRDGLQNGVLDAVDATLSIGSLRFTLGDLLLFAGIVWLSFQLSRFLRFVLEEEVYLHLPLRRGLPYAISALVHYGILLLGFLLAVLSSGIDLNRFALLAGALGVGVGFGLQNVVNNFVSGLILLFERPIQVGDTVEIGALLGDVRRIGIRSSTVRTWEGAEVIVPNASFVSDRVTNWTLSDPNRRIDVQVGVAYGNDPQAVIELLVEVARAHPDVLATPAPEVHFLGFGDSSLDFQIRSWTSNFAQWLRIQSEIAVAASHALRDADIEIPFPQRDLHLRSVAPEVERALSSDRD